MLCGSAAGGAVCPGDHGAGARHADADSWALHGHRGQGYTQYIWKFILFTMFTYFQYPQFNWHLAWVKLAMHCHRSSHLWYCHVNVTVSCHVTNIHITAPEVVCLPVCYKTQQRLICKHVSTASPAQPGTLTLLSSLLLRMSKMMESIFFCRAWEAYIGSKISHMYFHIYTHSILYEESSIYVFTFVLNLQFLFFMSS